MGQKAHKVDQMAPKVHQKAPKVVLGVIKIDPGAPGAPSWTVITEGQRLFNFINRCDYRGKNTRNYQRYHEDQRDHRPPSKKVPDLAWSRPFFQLPALGARTRFDCGCCWLIFSLLSHVSALSLVDSGTSTTKRLVVTNPGIDYGVYKIGDECHCHN